MAFHHFLFIFTDFRTSHPTISRDIDDSTELDVDDEKPSHLGSDVQPANCSNVNKQLSTQDDLMMNIPEDTAYTNKDHNSVLSDKELCEGTIKSFSCTRCEISFASMEELTSHCETHKTVVEHHCDVCGKSFKLKSDLKRHQLVHTGERPFPCNVCDKRFTHKSSLTTHLRIHSGERPFKCDVCDKRFTRKIVLTAHQRIHSGDKPFKCDVCSKCFTWKSNLNKHGLTHSQW